MLTEESLHDLREKGYAVINDVISKQECDEAISFYKDWLSNFGDRFPKTFQSIIKGHNVGHMEATWKLRLKTKPLFEQLWKTEKLLTSMDAIAIGRPPEDGVETYHDSSSKYWLHVDHTPSRIGLHAYQGSLFLEEQTKSDWTFQVMEGSHKYMDNFFKFNPEKAKVALRTGFYYRLKPDDDEYFRQLGCRITRIPVQKGGMILWDSRLVHANARPLPNRKNKGRWRYVIFVSMTPAIWANGMDLEKLREAYNTPTITTHWSSQGVRVLDVESIRGIPFPREVPEVARTEEVMKLCGVLPYDFNDRQPNGNEFRPVWKKFDRSLAPELNYEAKFANGHI